MSDLAYILHSRPYTDTRDILELFTQQHGRVSVVYRSNKKARALGRKQQFTPFSVSWTGRGGLKTLQSIEQIEVALAISSETKRLYSALYLNEVLMRSLPPMDAHPNLFQLYESVLKSLFSVSVIEETLRIFELFLLEEMGYGIEFSFDAAGKSICLDEYYHFVLGTGFMVAEANPLQSMCIVQGKHLAMIDERNFSDKETLIEAKKICRLAMPQVIGNKPLKSRELFV